MLQANVQQSQEFIHILHTYGRVSGQQINLDKSAITFGSRIQENIKHQIHQITQIANTGGVGKYLGLPECLKGSKRKCLSFIYENLTKRLSGWNSRLLSVGGKEVLLKAVATAMPVYAMSCFQLPKASCKSLSSAMAQFWWNANENTRKIHWKSWDYLCLPKYLGGMGFKDILSFNQALLAKQAWRILVDSDSILARLYKSRYFQNTSFLESDIGRSSSYGWRSVCFGKKLLEKGILRSIGDGSSTKVWSDLWLPMIPRRAPFIKNPLYDWDQTVSEIINVVSKDWRYDKLQELFFPQDIDLIIMTKPAPTLKDSWLWKFTNSGKYEVKSGYDLAFRENKGDLIFQAAVKPSLNGLKERVWNLKTAPKIKHFWWRALNNSLPVAHNLVKRNIPIENICQVCNIEDESANHILFQCTYARQVWALSGIPHPQGGFSDESLFSNTHYILSLVERKDLDKNLTRSLPWIFWNLWKNRNAWIFKANRYQADETLRKTYEDADQWFTAQVEELPENQRLVSSPVLKDIKWRPPSFLNLKCNIGIAWEKIINGGGAALIIRDHNGTVILHSRRFFAAIKSLSDQRFLAISWAIESIVSLGFINMIFAVDLQDIVSAVEKPQAWPSLRPISAMIHDLFQKFSSATLVWEPKPANRCANLIAQSAASQRRMQSYVAAGPPSWLIENLNIERPIALLL